MSLITETTRGLDALSQGMSMKCIPDPSTSSSLEGGNRTRAHRSEDVEEEGEDSDPQKDQLTSSELPPPSSSSSPVTRSISRSSESAEL